MTVRLFQQYLPSPSLFAATGRGMQFSFSFLYNLINDIHGRQPVINEGADWHMSGTDSLLHVESSAPWQNRTGTESLLMQKNGPFYKTFTEQSCVKLSDTIPDKKLVGNQFDFQTKQNKTKKNKRLQKQVGLACWIAWRVLHVWSCVTCTA